MSVVARDIALQAVDGHRWSLHLRIPAHPTRALLWLPAMGVSARHYLAFAEALNAQGVAVGVHEWRGHGSSSLRAGASVDWGYRELLANDLPMSEAALASELPGIPRVIGGHSLGGQLACCRLALAPATVAGLWLVASGAPYWRAFPPRTRWLLPPTYRFLPWLADRRGSLPGRALGFGGNEARTFLHDWANSGLGGRYAALGMDAELEASLGRVDAPVRAVVLSRDWLAPDSSLRFLLGKLDRPATQVQRLDAAVLGTRADHFSWMQRPRAVASALAANAADHAHSATSLRSGLKSMPVM